ncbi:MAG: tRNA 2-selenouridine(34) synthase MnmH [Bacteroidota bacterium]|nr:tRNA 2-selenouridine(34) synthase MnmH [Bacteroidota bacterium]
MPIEKLPIDRFLESGKKFPILDVRSPGEYKHAHIPGACNLPLFTDEERKVVGTVYKQQSREAAIKIGLGYFGPRMREMIEYVESLTGSSSQTSGSRQVLVHCWRGGMRSAGVAWLLDLYGFKVYTLAGGYKSYRNWVLETFSLPFSFNILGGYTGSGKTYVLDELEKKGAAVINLEKLASHKGSAFGDIGMPDQPTQEMFENVLSHELRTLFNGNNDSTGIPSPIWLEDESQRIGQINLPNALWSTMRQSPILFMVIPFEERLKHIVQEYGSLDKERMARGIVRIQKRLGPMETKTSLQMLDAGDIESCFRILLKYYDKQYNKALNNREQLQSLLTNMDCTTVNAKINADKITAKTVLYGIGLVSNS